MRSPITPEGEAAKQRLVESLRKNLKVEFLIDSENVDLISVSLRSRDPDLAAEIPNALVANYMEWVQQNIASRLDASRRFLAQQVSICEARLAELEQQKTQFEVKHAGMWLDSPGALWNRINEIHADLDTSRLQQQTAKKELVRLESLLHPAALWRRELEGKSGQIQVNYGLLQVQLHYLEDELRAARLQSAEQHPTVKTLRTSIAWVNKNLAKLKPQLPPDFDAEAAVGVVPVPKPDEVRAALAATRSKVETTTAQIERLEKQLKRHEHVMADFTAVRQQYLSILKRISVEQAEAERWQSRLDEVQMALRLDVAKRRTHLESVRVAERKREPDPLELWRVVIGSLAISAAYAGMLTGIVASWRRSVRMTIVYIVLIVLLMGSINWLWLSAMLSWRAEGHWLRLLIH